MWKWEYRQEACAVQLMTPLLNKLGPDGWELVALFPCGVQGRIALGAGSETVPGVLMVLKRPILENNSDSPENSRCTSLQRPREIV